MAKHERAEVIRNLQNAGSLDYVRPDQFVELVKDTRTAISSTGHGSRRTSRGTKGRRR